MEMTLKNRILSFYLILVFCPIVVTAESNKLKKVILIDDDKAVYSEVLDDGSNWFLRDDQKGIPIGKSRVKAVVDKDYYDSVKYKSPLSSSFESILYFHSSANYQWNENKDKIVNETLFFQITKLTLILATVYFYNESIKANEALKNSVYGLSSNTERKFNEQYRNYQISASLTLLTFTYSAILAYIRFGKDSNFDNLNIQNRNILEIQEISKIENEKKTTLHTQQNYIEFAMSKKF